MIRTLSRTPAVGRKGGHTRRHVIGSHAAEAARHNPREHCFSTFTAAEQAGLIPVVRVDPTTSSHRVSALAAKHMPSLTERNLQLWNEKQHEWLVLLYQHGNLKKIVIQGRIAPVTFYAVQAAHLSMLATFPK